MPVTLQRLKKHKRRALLRSLVEAYRVAFEEYASSICECMSDRCCQCLVTFADEDVLPFPFAFPENFKPHFKNSQVLLKTLLDKTLDELVNSSN